MNDGVRSAAGDLDYLRRMLQLSPRDDAQRIVAERRAHFAEGARGATLLDDESVVLARERRLSAQLDELRRVFWSLETHDLDVRLAALDVAGCPGLAAQAGRLREAARFRADVMAVTNKAGIAGGFAEAIREILIAAPRDAALMREAAIDALHSAATPRERKRAAACRRLIERIAADSPGARYLEPEWFERILRLPLAPSPARRRTLRALAFAFMAVITMEWLAEVFLGLSWALLRWLGR